MCIVYSKVKQRSRRCSDCRKSIKSVAVGGHAPTTATPPGKFYGKLCARNEVTSARFAVKFCRRAAEPSAACGGCSEAKQGQRSQNASAVQGAPHDAGTATRTYTRGNSRVRQSPVSGLRAGPAARLASDTPLRRQCAAVAPCAACRVSRHAAQQALLFSRFEQRRFFSDTPQAKSQKDRQHIPKRGCAACLFAFLSSSTYLFTAKRRAADLYAATRFAHHRRMKATKKDEVLHFRKTSSWCAGRDSNPRPSDS